MTAIPSGTKFIGISPNVPTPENRSALSNNYQEVYTIDDIISATGTDDFYNLDGTMSSNRTVDLDGNFVTFTNGNFGIGTITPDAIFHVKQTAVPSAGEEIARFSVSDDSNSRLSIINSTTGNNVFYPAVIGTQGSTGEALALVGKGTTDTGTNALVVFDGRIGSSAAVTRPLFKWSNFDVAKMIMSAAGDLGIGVTSPNAKLHINNTGSLYSLLVEDDTTPDSTPFAVDSSGYVNVGSAISGPEKLSITNANAAIIGVNNINTGLRLQYGAGSSFWVNTPSLSLMSIGGRGTVAPAVGVINITQTENVGIGTATPAEKLDVVGKVKAETVQLTTGAGANKYLVSDASGNGSWVGLPTSEVIAASDETTALTTGTAKVTFRMPYAMNVTAVRASLSTAQTSGSILTVDINEGGNSILSTKLTIDNTEKTSTTAATPAVISDNVLADDAEITIDIDQIGDGTAKGLKVTLIGTRA